jgi:hypothetical protein
MNCASLKSAEVFSGAKPVKAANFVGTADDLVSKVKDRVKG